MRSIGNGVITITPSANTLAKNAAGRYPCAFHCGGAGTLEVVAADGSTAAFTVPAGGVVSVECQKILDTSTATNIVGIYLP